MKHLDLFSGAVSGFSFAASYVWPDCEHVALCEIDPWRRKQLNRIWPGVPIIEDVRCFQKENLLQIEEILKSQCESTESLKQSLCAKHASDHSNITDARQSEINGFARGNVESRECAERKVRTHNGLGELKVLQEKGGVNVRDYTGQTKESPIGERQFSPETDINAECAVIGPIRVECSERTISVHGQGSPNLDSPYRMVSPYVVNVIRSIMEGEPIDLLTASPPCTPASCAGKRKGKEDGRWLWPETIEAIAFLRPTNIILENPTGLLSLADGMEYESICVELENQGYEVQTYIIPASAVGAWHRRNRVWIIAGRSSPVRGEIIGNAKRSEGRSEIAQRGPAGRTAPAGDNLKTCANTIGPRLEGHAGDGNRGNEPGRFSPKPHGSVTESPWNMHWLQAVSDLCNVVDERDPDNSRDTIEAERAKWIAALGDSIVIPLVIEIMKAIKEADCV